MASLFFSYSHKDEALRDELEVHLAMLKREGSIDAWHDRRIVAGDSFEGAIDSHLEAADVILLLVSSDFLASGYCYDVEAQKALELHRQGKARVIPVILRPCDWQSTPLAKLLAVPCDGKPVSRWADKDEAFLDVVQQIRNALPEVEGSSLEASLKPQPAPTAMVSRSSNLRLKKQFTEADQDRFLDESFDFMAKYFETSLRELQERNAGIEASFKKIDARTFTAIIYRHGKTASRCTIRYGGGRGFGSGITFSHNDTTGGISFNESLSVEIGEQSFSLKSMGMAITRSSGTAGSRLSMEGAAEYYWSMLIQPLQR